MCSLMKYTTGFIENLIGIRYVKSYNFTAIQVLKDFGRRDMNDHLVPTCTDTFH